MKLGRAEAEEMIKLLVFRMKQLETEDLSRMVKLDRREKAPGVVKGQMNVAQ